LKEKNQFKEIKAIKQLNEIIKNKNSSIFYLQNNEIFFTRKKSLDELYRQNFFMKTTHSQETIQLKDLLKKSCNNISITSEILDPQIKKFKEINKKNFICEYITISGAFKGCLQITQKEIYFFTKTEHSCEQFHQNGVPVFY